MKINLDVGLNCEHKEWQILDHKINKNEKFKIKGNLNNINLKSKSWILS